VQLDEDGRGGGGREGLQGASGNRGGCIEQRRPRSVVNLTAFPCADIIFDDLLMGRALIRHVT
jgi:hypothetical protein